MITLSNRNFLRWMAGVGGIGVGTWLLRRYGDVEQIGDQLPQVIGSVTIIVAGIAAFVPDLIRLVEVFAQALFHPGGSDEKPTPNFKLAEFYARNHRGEEALDEYEVILKHYPEDVRGWTGAIELLVNHFGAYEQARDYYHRGRRQLRRDAEASEQLEQCWHHLQASPVAR